MFQIRKLPTLLVRALVPMVFVGCATQIHVTRMAPAEVNLKGVKRVAVARMTGTDGDTLAAMITQKLVESKRFDVLERSELDKIASENRIALDAALQGGGAELGKVLPATAVVVGNVEESTKNQNVTQANDTCYRDEKVGNKSVSVKYACTRYTRAVKVRFVASVRIFDTNTSRILATKRLASSNDKQTSSTEGDPDAIDADALLEGCREEVANAFLKMVAPYAVDETVKLEDDGALPELAQGNEYLKRGDPASALQFFTRAVARASATPSLGPKTQGRAHYSFGLGKALVGDYETALAEIRIASQLNQDTEWMDLEGRIKVWKRDADKVAEQMNVAAPPQ